MTGTHPQAWSGTPAKGSVTGPPVIRDLPTFWPVGPSLTSAPVSVSREMEHNRRSCCCSAGRAAPKCDCGHGRPELARAGSFVGSQRGFRPSGTETLKRDLLNSTRGEGRAPGHWVFLLGFQRSRN